MRVIRGLAALTVLLAGGLGLPWLLVRLTTILAPALQRWSEPLTLLREPDPSAILLMILLAVAWAAWVVFAAGVVGELIGLMSGYRLQIRLPGLRSVQRLASGLLISVVAMIATTQASSAGPAPSGPVTTVPAESGNDESRPAVTPATHKTPRDVGQAAATQPERAHIHVVEPGDDLWSLSQRYYGRGSDWRRIANANPDKLSGGPDRLRAGWRLSIPDAELHKSGAKAERGDRAEARDRSVVVERGDTLSAIAEREYGAQRRWPVIWRANRHQLDDPDELTIGMRLVVPDRRAGDHGAGDRRADEPNGARGDADGTAETATDRPTERTRRPTPAARSTAPGPDRATPSDRDPRSGPDGDPGNESAGATCDDSGTSEESKDPAAPASQGSSEPGPGPNPPAPDQPAPDQPAPNQPAPNQPPAQPLPDPPGGAASVDPAVVAAGIGSVGALLAAAIVTGLAARRRMQLQTRPVGRRILHPSLPAQRIEAALGRRARPVGLRALDLATRAISAHCHQTGSALPALTVATVSDETLELHWSAPPSGPPPEGFRSDGDRWLLDAADVALLKTVPGLTDAVRPYPALVTLGFDAESRPVVGDLETLGLLHLDARDPALVEAALAAMALELSFSPWAEEMILTLVGPLAALPDALGRHDVSRIDDVDALLDRLEARAAVQRDQSSLDRPGAHRVDPDLADPWAPEIVLISEPVERDQHRRLHRLLTTEPRVTIAAVLPYAAAEEPGWTLHLDRSSGTLPGALEPIGRRLAPQLLEQPAAAAVIELVTVTGSEATTAAPWWSSQPVGTAADPDPPPDNVSYLGRGHPRRFGGWAEGPDEADNTDREGSMIRGAGEAAEHVALHPTLLILGPVELVGATGSVPPRAAKQCLEYCGWLLENPGSTAHAMAASLVVAEGTRRSNMSRLRSWLGHDEAGDPYLPDAYSGRIVLHDAVSSDWQRFQILTAGGIDRAGTAALRAALSLVRGAPLADAAPGQWHWAEELRTDMISAVRDLGVELARRALIENDIDLARWAAARALAAAPGDEALLVARIQTEHRAGHRGDVERLSLQLAGQARQLGVDLAPETVSVLQQVLEGRVRARMA